MVAAVAADAAAAESAAAGRAGPPGRAPGPPSGLLAKFAGGRERGRRWLGRRRGSWAACCRRGSLLLCIEARPSAAKTPAAWRSLGPPLLPPALPASLPPSLASPPPLPAARRRSLSGSLWLAGSSRLTSRRTESGRQRGQGATPWQSALAAAARPASAPWYGRLRTPVLSFPAGLVLSGRMERPCQWRCGTGKGAYTVPRAQGAHSEGGTHSLVALAVRGTCKGSELTQAHAPILVQSLALAPHQAPTPAHPAAMAPKDGRPG